MTATIRTRDRRSPQKSGRRCGAYVALADAAVSRRFRAQDIFVFVVGGATYEEARAVALLNAANKQQRIILGSTCLLNSASFLKEFETAAAAL